MSGIKICCIGAGYVGVPTMAVLAVECPDVEVFVVDISEDRIRGWSDGTSPEDLPIFEPGLFEALQECRDRNLFFSKNIGSAIERSDIIFVCVNTPTKTSGLGAGRASNLAPWEAAGRSIAKYAQSSKIVVEKSTVPVRTAETLKTVLKSSSEYSFTILSNPEFMAEGTAMKDLKFPDRVLIGGPSTPDGIEAVNMLCSIYSRWIPKEKLIVTNLWSSELSKLVANAFLAQRVSSINAVSLICERTGADVDEVALAIGTDSRIGKGFLKASVGFGGSCFKKDILSLVYLCEKFGLPQVGEYWNQIIVLNQIRTQSFVNEIVSSMFGTVTGKKIAVFGFAFKKDTSDTRESAAISVCSQLGEEGAVLRIFDPRVSRAQILEDLQSTMKCERVEVCESPEEAATHAHAIVITTEWDMFRDLDYGDILSRMNKPAFLFDGRNVLNHAKLVEMGFNVKAIGKSLH